MDEYAITFSTPMVRALLNGRKTQTRRVLKPQPEPFDAMFSNAGRWWTGDADTGEVRQLLRVSYATGDRLWVKEAWRAERGYDGARPTDMSPYSRIWWEADESNDNADAIGRYRHARFMPRWASRLTLLVTDARVQRVQEISEADAQAEGVEMESADPPFYYVRGIWPHSITATGCEEPGGRHAARSFAKLWDHLHGPDAWAANPWVVALTFTVERQNRDRLPPSGTRPLRTPTDGA